MIRFFLIFYFLALFIKVYGSAEANDKIFMQQLLEWNIDYFNLDYNKAGAGCMVTNSKEYNSLGLSYNLADIEYAKKIALQGCEQMKKKKKILSECKCEIILINNNLK